MEDKKKAESIDPSSLGLDLEPLLKDQGFGDLGPLVSQVDFGLVDSDLDLTDLTEFTGKPNISDFF